MSERNIELNITPGEKGEIIFGKTMIVLEDQSRGIYKTDNLEDFFGQCSEEGRVTVFQNGFRLEMFLTQDLVTPGYNTKAQSICDLREHPLLTELKRHQNTNLTSAGFSNLLRTFKNYLDPKTLAVSDSLSDLKIKKIISVINKNDKRGNFAFAVTAESGKQDYQFPERIKFTIPMLQNNDEKIELEFDLLFDWKVGDQQAFLEFKIVNLEINTIVEESIYSAIQKLVDGKKNLVLRRGSYSLIPLTDNFKYQESNIDV